MDSELILEVSEKELSEFPDPSDNSIIPECTQPTEPNPPNIHNTPFKTEKKQIPSLLSLQIPIPRSIVNATKTQNGRNHRRHRSKPCHKRLNQDPGRREKRKNQQTRTAPRYSKLPVHSSGQTDRACDRHDGYPQERQWEDQRRTGTI